RFSYNADALVLADVSVQIAPRDHVALVGATGSGKTTLLRLLVGFHDPQAGSIRFDGTPTTVARIDDLRRVVCCVEQQSFLFTGTIVDNVRYGSPDADQQRVDEALRLVGLDVMLSALPAGSRTLLSDAGRQLSGGERQRIALARAIVRDPPVLVLDEATSAVDGETEAALFDRLQPWLARRTVVAVAHRLSTV